MEEMIDRYKHTRKILRALRTINTDESEREIIGGMLSDCNYTIEWLGTGRRPGNMRGIERRAAYQREIPIDPLRIQAFIARGSSGSPTNLSDGQRFQIEEAMRTLSPLERKCFELAYGQCIPHREIGIMLSLSKGNVSTLLQRAQEKIKKNTHDSLFFTE